MSTIMLIVAALAFALPPLPHTHDEDGPASGAAVAGGCRDLEHPVPHISGARSVAPAICLACVIGTRSVMVTAAAAPRFAIHAALTADPLPTVRVTSPLGLPHAARGPPALHA